jgi:hypothetical protein
MNKSAMSFALGAAAPILLWTFMVTLGRAQDPVQLNPEMFKVLLEDERVRVIDDRVPAGAKVAMHSHGEYVVYPLTSYTMKFTFPDGTSRVVEVQQGTPRHVKGIVHAEENIGTTEAHAVLIELKEAAK